MPSISPIVKSGLVSLGAFLAAFNVAINILDLVTTFLGFSRGMPEQNSAAALFMTIVGNEYLGTVIIKAAFIAACVVAYSAIRAVGRKREDQILSILSLLLLDLVLAYLGSIVMTAVLGNFIALRWL